MKVASQKAHMCRERAVAARKLADSAPTLAQREAARAAEQQWLRSARLYELMDQILSTLVPAETEQQQNEEGQALAQTKPPAVADR
jgi:hypothetical protein